MSARILISRTFDEVTPESAEDGDVSDSGFVYENEPFTFSELVREIRRGGFSCQGNADWLTSYPETDYRTCTERTESLHFSRDNPARLEKWFRLAIKAARTR